MFLSRTMQVAERDYKRTIDYSKISNKIETIPIKYYRKVWTDHENLKYFREPYKLNRQQAR